MPTAPNDAAHRMPILTTEMTFEVVTDGRIHQVSGARLKSMDREAAIRMEGFARVSVQAEAANRRLDAGRQCPIDRTPLAAFSVASRGPRA
jgi:hypothetical protein